MQARLVLAKLIRFLRMLALTPNISSGAVRACLSRSGRPSRRCVQSPHVRNNNQVYKTTSDGYGHRRRACAKAGIKREADGNHDGADADSENDHSPRRRPATSVILTCPISFRESQQYLIGSSSNMVVPIRTSCRFPANTLMLLTASSSAHVERCIRLAPWRTQASNPGR